MQREGLIGIGICDIAGQLRGKMVPAPHRPARIARGIGWTPACTMISCFGHIGDPTFGTGGDIMLLPDPATEVEVDFGDGQPRLHMLLADIVELDGAAWSCCPRDFLRRGLTALEEEFGVVVDVGFEHEFFHLGVPAVPGTAYGFSALRAQGSFGEHLVAALNAAGVAPETFHAEYAPQQYEIAMAPGPALRAADRAVLLREVTRLVAHYLGARVSFAPILDPAGVGSGAHIHVSLADSRGRHATYAPGEPLGLTKRVRQFIAGWQRHAAALCALTAPSAASYIRMRPNRWAPVRADVVQQDRGAAIRVCPVPLLEQIDPAASANVEFRASDATASPYLALGALVWAGLEGLRAGAEPEATGPDLPRSLGAALDAMQADAATATWLGPVFHAAYLAHKRAELRELEGLDEAAICARYAEVY
jgi:glutamine synthetase